MRTILKGSLTYRYVVLNPTLKPGEKASGKHAYFRLEKRTKNSEGKVTGSPKVEHPTLKSINENYLAGRLDYDAAKKNLKDLVEQLYKDDGALKAVTHNTENQQLLKDYWTAEYEGRELIDPKTARYELERAVEAVGMLSLHSATKDQLQKVVDQAFKGNKQRRIIAKLNLLLRFAKRPDVKLRRTKKEKKRPKYLTETDFLLVLPHLPSDETRVLAKVAFYTGCRIGEAFSLEPQDFDQKLLELQIARQVDRTDVERDTKNRRDRTALVFPNGIPALKEWFKVKGSVDMATRLYMARILRAACVAVFPTEKSKHLKFHDLRHCYAIMLRGKGLTTEDVADLIGDSILVCKEHYTGFGATDDLMATRRARLKA
jgi:integrase